MEQANNEAFSQIKDAIAMELNALAEEMREACHSFGFVPFPAEPSYLERTLLEKILIEPPSKGNVQSVRKKLFSDGKNSELLISFWS